MEKPENELNYLERVVFAIGLIILITLIGYLSFEWYNKTEKPPDLQISFFQDKSYSNNTYRVETKNTGKETAKSVNLKFDLYQDGRRAETAVLEIDYVPVRSKEIGWISFTRRISASDSVVVSTISFLKP